MEESEVVRVGAVKASTFAPLAWTRVPRRTVAAVIGGLFGVLLAVVAPAFACTPSAQLTRSATEGQGGSTLLLTGAQFLGPAEARPIEVRWDSEESPVVATGAGPAFALAVTVPSDVGLHYLIATQQLRSNGALNARVTTTFDVTSPAPARGYRLVAADGGIFAFGDAGFYGSTGGIPLNRPIVGMAATPSGKGYWLVASDGGMFAFGDAGFYGSTGGIPLNRPIVGMAASPSGGGYWLVASDGGIFAFGDARFLGSAGGIPLHRPIVGMAATAVGAGYWLVAADGGVFAFGDAFFFGAVDQPASAKPIIGMARTGTGKGYWMTGSDGGIVTKGDAGFFGSTGGSPLNRPVVGLSPSSTGNGYHLVASDGGIFAFGDAAFYGSTGGIPLNQPVVGVAATSSTASTVCRNSRDPACGPFRWDPQPAPNQQLAVSFATAPTTAVVGQEVVFEVAWSDDAPLTFQAFDVRPGRFTHIDCFPFPPGFGPWTPPPAVPSSGTLRFAHTFAVAGTYRVAAVLGTGEASSPYGSCSDTESPPIVVTPRP